MLRQLEPINLSAGYFNVNDHDKFKQGLALIKESLFDKGATLFCSDNVITWNRNLSFLRDEFFLEILNNNENNNAEKCIIWRTYILLYFAEIASSVEGDFLELGCHTGFTASQVIKKIKFKELSKKYYLYDLFEWKKGDEHTRFPGHDNPRMFEDVQRRFSEFDFVKVIKGAVPESFVAGFPDKIAFAHIDMNHPDPEAGALRAVLPRLSKGGAVILDDYGWWGYGAQKIALDPIVKENGLAVLELPTGQGLILK
jgi:SAM-dependent methyltransferase